MSDTVEDKIGLNYLKEIVNKYCAINLRSNRKLYGLIKFIDYHFNLILHDVIEIKKVVRKNKETKKKETKIVETKFMNLFVRGDNIISISEDL